MEWRRTVAGTVMGQDVTLSGLPYQALNASANDWLALDLRHVGSRRNVGGLSLGVTANDLGKGNLGKGNSPGQLGKGGSSARATWVRATSARATSARGISATSARGTSDRRIRRLGTWTWIPLASIGNAPALMAPTVQKPSISLFWTPPHVDKFAILRYDIFRVIGTAVTPTNLSTLPLASVLPTTAAIQTYVDFTVKNNVTYTYFVRAVFDGPQIGKTGEVNSGISNFQTILKK